MIFTEEDMAVLGEAGFKKLDLRSLLGGFSFRQKAERSDPIFGRIEGLTINYQATPLVAGELLVWLHVSVPVYWGDKLMCLFHRRGEGWFARIKGTTEPINVSGTLSLE